jgi:formylglycine-generating enzyme required for sulfatase activity
MQHGFLYWQVEYNGLSGWTGEGGDGVFWAEPLATEPLSTTSVLVVTPTDDPQPVLERAQNFSGGNNDWEPFIQDFNGVEMVLVPTGCFMMGSTEEQLEASFQVCLGEPFWIDRTEVTNAQVAFWGGQAGQPSYRTDGSNPRDSITWAEANSFCASRDARLPTEAEWEYVVWGPDSWVYPWGNDLDRAYVVYDGEIASPVGSRPDGISWVGALDMSGNVAEWVADW